MWLCGSSGIMTGAELNAIDDAELSQRIKTTVSFAAYRQSKN
jgi:hypothetical protein